MGIFRHSVPPAVTLLDADFKDESEWTLDEWKAHALRLRYMVQELRTELASLQTRLSRRKKPQKVPKSQRITTLITSPQSRREDKAWEVLHIREELETTHKKKVTDRQALEEWYSRKGHRRSRAANDRTTLNAVSALRRRLKRSLR